MQEKSVYIAHDFEGTGPRLGIHSPLSFGACVVPRSPLSISDLISSPEYFYAELQPKSYKYDLESLRVGCSQLECLEPMRSDPTYNVNSDTFDPSKTLFHMQSHCESPRDAVARFREWIDRVRGEAEVIGVVDTAFYDGGHLHLLFGEHSEERSPYGWKGLELTSLYQGYTRNANARQGTLVPDTRKRPHHAGEDAAYAAQIAMVILFEKLGWR